MVSEDEGLTLAGPRAVAWPTRARGAHGGTMRFETLAVHAGTDVDAATGAVTPPIHLSTTFERAPDGSFPGGFSYTRSGNPNRRSLEACLASLEGGAAAAAFASGQAATFAILQGLRPGDHVIAPLDAYYGTIDLLLDHFGAWGLETTLVDLTDTAAIARALRPRTRLVWVETPSNPTMRMTDIAAVVEVAHAGGASPSSPISLLKNLPASNRHQPSGISRSPGGSRCRPVLVQQGALGVLGGSLLGILPELPDLPVEKSPRLEQASALRDLA
jgi:hypothetical protein